MFKFYRDSCMLVINEDHQCILALQFFDTVMTVIKPSHNNLSMSLPETEPRPRWKRSFNPNRGKT